MRRAGLAMLALYLVTLAVNRSLVRVRGRSMEPTYHDGDVLLTLPCRRSEPRPGRAVVVEEPWHDGHLVVKRVHRIYHHGIDVRGDAPEHSTDSRAWGLLPHEALRRTVVARVGNVHALPSR